jgi:flagellar biogenesis protein FliO
MKKIIFYCMMLHNHVLFSADALQFKEELKLPTYWLAIGAVLLLILVTLLIVMKKNPLKMSQTANLKLLEKRTLSHKTCVYLLEYRGLKFLLADNHANITLHPLEDGLCYEKK